MITLAGSRRCLAAKLMFAGVRFLERALAVLLSGARFIIRHMEPT